MKTHYIRHGITLVILAMTYMLVREFIRPYVIANYSCSICEDILYSIPNFIGALMMFFFFFYFLKYSKMKTFSFSLLLVVLFELHDVYFENSKFDVRDIFFSLAALLLCLFLSKSNSKNQIP